MDTIVVQERMARAHFQSMGTAMDLITLGDLDFLLTLKTEKELFRPWIDQFIEVAVKEGEATAAYYKRFCRIGAFDVDVNNQKIRFAGWLPEGHQLRALLIPGSRGYRSG